MTKIDYKPQLDYNNVLIRPKRSTLVSRSQVDLNRTFKFSQKHTSAKSITLVTDPTDRSTNNSSQYGYYWNIGNV